MKRHAVTLLQKPARAIPILQDRYDPTVHDDEYEHRNAVGLHKDPDRVHEREARIPVRVRLVPHLLADEVVARVLPRLVGRLVALVDEQLHARDAHRHEPHHDETHALLPLGLERVVLERIGHGKEAVDGERGQREYAAVHAEHLYEAREGTHERAEDPLAQDGVDERERYAEDGHEQVEHGQVHQVDADVQERGAEAAAHDYEHENVAQDGQDHRGRVQDGEEDRGEQAVREEAAAAAAAGVAGRAGVVAERPPVQHLLLLVHALAPVVHDGVEQVARVHVAHGEERLHALRRRLLRAPRVLVVPERADYARAAVEHGRVRHKVLDGDVAAAGEAVKALRQALEEQLVRRVHVRIHNLVCRCRRCRCRVTRMCRSRFFHSLFSIIYSFCSSSSFFSVLGFVSV
jgi:hypothetical protein